MPNTIRQPMLSGYRQIEGIWLPNDLLDESQRITRLIQYWQPGCRVYRFKQGDMLTFAEKKSMDCTTLAGWPLIRYGKTYSTAPLDNDEITTLPRCDLWLIRHGTITALSFSEAETIVLANYINLQGYAFENTDNHAQIYVVEPQALPTADKDTRSLIGNNIPPASTAQKAFLQSAAAHSAIETKKRAQAKYDVNSSSNISSSLIQKLISKLLPTQETGSHRTSDTTSSLPTWQRWLHKISMQSGLTSLIGRQQANYISKMMKMFEDDNIDQALRHGIPLGRNAGGEELPSPYFGRLKGRDKLEIQPHHGQGRGIYLGDEAENYLRQLYRQQFIKLDKAGHNEEALFVLAELLQERDEALDYLESFQRYQQAAELARLWAMSPVRIIRLLCLSGDIESAIEYAKLHGAFSSVIFQLQNDFPEIAARLREEWAEFLASTEDYLKAVEVIWSLNTPHSQERAKEWLEIAYQAGGKLSLNSLVKWAFLMPDSFAQYQHHIDSILSDPLAINQRATLAKALVALPKQSFAIHKLINQLVCQVIIDQYQPEATLTTKDVKQLIKQSTNRLLKADLPTGSLPDSTYLSFDNHKTCLLITPPESGIQAIYDVIALEDRHYLVALGELGVMLIDANGKACWHKSTPTHYIVIADNQQSALLLLSRESYVQISHLSFTTQTVTELGTLKLTTFANSFDGNFWSIAINNAVHVVDIKNKFKIVWSVDSLPNNVIDICRSQNQESWLISGDECERWVYALPDRRLISRKEVFSPEEENHRYDISSDMFYILNGNKIELSYSVSQYKRVLELPEILSDKMRESLRVKIETGTLAYWQDNDITTFCLYNSSRHCCFEIQWQTAAAPHFRAMLNHWCFFDKEGRLVHVDWQKSYVNRVSVF